MPAWMIDSETDPIDRALAAPPPVCWSWCDIERPRQTAQLESIEGAFPFIARWLEGDEVGFFCRASFDMAALAARYPVLLQAIFAKYKRGQIRDLQIDQKLIDIAYGKVQDSYKLESMCERYGLPIDKDQEVRTGYGKLRGVPAHEYPAKYRKYALEDVIQPSAIYAEQCEQERKWIARMGSPILHVSAAKARADWFLQLQSCWGVHTNPDRVRAFTRATERKLERLGKRLQRAKFPVRYPNQKKWGKKHQGHVLGPKGEYTGAFVRADGSKDKLVATTYITHLSERRGFELKLSEKTGEPSCDKDSAAASGSAVLEALCQYGSADTLLSRCTNLSEGFVYPLQCRYTGLLETGRTSCSAGKKKDGTWPTPLRGSQLQNPAKGGHERGCYEPPYPDWLFFDADFPSAELHSLGQVQIRLFGRSKLAELLIEDKDILCWFGATVLNGIPYEEAIARKKAGDKQVKGMRQLAKAVIYGLPGGLGAAKLVVYARTNYGVIITEKQAKAYKQVWLDAFPEMVWYFEWVNKLLRGRETGFMKHPMSEFWRGGAFYCALCNSPFQSLTAFAATDAGFYVAEEMYTVEDSPLYGTRGWGFVHDQILGTGPAERCSDAADRLGACMTERFNVWHPDVPIKPGKTEGCVMRVWSKDAEPVRNKITGKLDPWEPLVKLAA